MRTAEPANWSKQLMNSSHFLFNWKCCRRCGDTWPRQSISSSWKPLTQWRSTADQYPSTAWNIHSVFVSYFRSTLYYIDDAIEKLKNDPTAFRQNREPGVFEKLLKIDKHIAVVMSIDMFLAGVDTVSSILWLVSAGEWSFYLYRLRRQWPISCIT